MMRSERRYRSFATCTRYLYAGPLLPPIATRLSGQRSRTSKTKGTRSERATSAAARAAKSCGEEPIITSGFGSVRLARLTDEPKVSQFQARRQLLVSYAAAHNHLTSTPSRDSVRQPLKAGSDRRVYLRWCKCRSDARIVTDQPKRTSSRASSKCRVPPPSFGNTAN